MAGRFNALYDETAPAIVPPPAPNALAPPPTWADAATLAGQEIARQRQISADRGLWDQGGMTRAGVTDAAMQLSNMLATSTSAPGFRAYHGSPHSFDKFDTSKIGTGEGAQAYGHGLYVAENEAIARAYRDNLTIKPITPEVRAAQDAYNEAYWKVDAGGTQAEFDAAIAARDAAQANMRRVQDEWAKQPGPKGSMYEVNVNADPAHFLDWDKPLSEQTPHVQEALAKVPWAEPYMKTSLPGGQIVPHTAEAAQQLQEAGIPGIRYLDAGSRASGGTSNHVIFDANTIEILRKYGIAGLMAGGAAAATALPQQEPPT